MPQWVWLVAAGALVLAWAVWRDPVGLWVTLVVAVPAALVLSAFSPGIGRLMGGQEDGQRLRVVTWNVHNQFGQVARIARQLEALDADVICLQEASDHAFNDLFPGMVEARSTSLKLYVRGSLRPWQEPLDADPYFQRWLPVVATVRGVKLRVLNVHLHGAVGAYRLPRERQRVDDYLEGMRRNHPRQLRNIAAVSRDVGPVLVCGDLNSPPLSPYRSELKSSLRDAFEEMGFGLGLTYLIAGRVPAWRIDTLWCGPGVRPVRCFTGHAAPSDHRPVIADILVSSEPWSASALQLPQLVHEPQEHESSPDRHADLHQQTVPQRGAEHPVQHVPHRRAGHPQQQEVDPFPAEVPLLDNAENVARNRPDHDPCEYTEHARHPLRRMPGLSRAAPMM